MGISGENEYIRTCDMSLPFLSYSSQLSVQLITVPLTPTCTCLRDSLLPLLGYHTTVSVLSLQ
jgi:hypothetical protein